MYEKWHRTKTTGFMALETETMSIHMKLCNE